MIVYRELSSLEQDLGIPAKTLYAVSNSINRHYHTAQLPKKEGGYRSLSIPDETLKTIQRRITNVLLVHMPISRYAMAYRYGGSTLRNAKSHVGKSMVLKLDILHFFDSIRYSAVKEKAFPAAIYAEPIRILLSMLCYHKDALPQGAPSSPAITNILLLDFDEDLGKWCLERGISYSRYCDDMTFSGDFDAREVISCVRTALKKMGFLLNEQKTRLQCSGQQQNVTGIVVNEKPSVPARYRRRLRQELYFCRKFGISEHIRKLGLDIPEQAYAEKLLGQVNYVLHIAPQDEAMQQARAWLKEQFRFL